MKCPEVDAEHRSRASYTSVLCPKPKLRSGCAQPSNLLVVVAILLLKHV